MHISLYLYLLCNPLKKDIIIIIEKVLTFNVYTTYIEGEVSNRTPLVGHGIFCLTCVDTSAG